MAKPAAKAPRIKLQQTVKVKDYGDDSINRLAVILYALEGMDARERHAALAFIKSKHSAEWPADNF